MVLRRTGEPAVWATGQNGFGMPVCVHVGTSSGVFERQRQQRVSPPGSRVHAMIDSRTGCTHVVTLRRDRVALHERLYRQSRACNAGPSTVHWDGQWANDGNGLYHEMCVPASAGTSGKIYAFFQNVRVFLSPVEIDIYFRRLESEQAAKDTMSVVVEQAAAVAAAHAHDRSAITAAMADHEARLDRVSATPATSAGGAQTTGGAGRGGTQVEEQQQRRQSQPQRPAQATGGAGGNAGAEDSDSGTDSSTSTSNSNSDVGDSGGGDCSGSSSDSTSDQQEGDTAAEQTWKGVSIFHFDRGRRPPLSAGVGGVFEV